MEIIDHFSPNIRIIKDFLSKNECQDILKVKDLSEDLWSLDYNLNYPKTLGIDKKKFIDLHDSNWNSLNKLSEYFNLMKIKKDILDYKTKNIYFYLMFLLLLKRKMVLYVLHCQFAFYLTRNSGYRSEFFCNCASIERSWKYLLDLISCLPDIHPAL